MQLKTFRKQIKLPAGEVFYRIYDKYGNDLYKGPYWYAFADELQNKSILSCEINASLDYVFYGATLEVIIDLDCYNKEYFDEYGNAKFYKYNDDMGCAVAH